MSRAVSLPMCTHCHRAIYPTGKGWVHATGLAHCYSPSGEKLQAEPRGPR